MKTFYFRQPIQATKQRGISLFIVIVLVMLSMLLALWASRTALYNEMIVGNDADYQRAFEAAQAMIQDAEFDIRGERSDGSACVPDPSAPSICRVNNASNIVWIPTEAQEVGGLLNTLDAAPAKCLKGLCTKRTGEQDFWNDKTTLASMMVAGVGARYGEYTGTKTGDSSNPILKFNQADDPTNQGAWYWIEVMPYDSNAGNSGLITNGSTNMALNLVPSVAYRITAVAYGLKPNTQVVVQSTYVRQKIKN